MSKLPQIREEIDAVDAQLSALFRRRLALSRAVAADKLESGSPIYHPGREADILREAEEAVPEAPLLSRSFYRNLMRLSRVHQYEQLIAAGRMPAVLAPLAQPRVCASLAHYGAPYSWSYSAARQLAPDAALTGENTFSAVFEAVASGRCGAGVVPLDNSTAGNVSDVYDLLIEYGLYITRSTVLDIEYVLAAPDGAPADGVRTVYSHPQALSQCADYLKARGIAPVSFASTSGSAEHVAAAGDPYAGALCSREAAEAYGLCVLEAGIRDSESNSTRFIYVEPQLCEPAERGIVSVAFSLPHRSGSLSAVTSLFADLGVNLAKIAARPIPERAWEYFFYLDFEGSLSDAQSRAALLFLESELPYFKLLGGYSL